MSKGYRLLTSVRATLLTSAMLGMQASNRDPLAEQDIVITLPASFDEVARELTVQAAAEAELPNVVLIEEPQAAFYAWVYKHREQLARARLSGAHDFGLRYRRWYF